MTYRLQRDGNFVARCGAHVVYSTRTGQGTQGDYFLGIHDSCILHLYKGSLDCNSLNVQEEIWTNIRLHPLERGDRLRKGEMVRHQGLTMVMQSSDGNLVVYDSLYEPALWGANQEWDGPPASNLREYYVRITSQSWMATFGGTRFVGWK